MAAAYRQLAEQDNAADLSRDEWLRGHDLKRVTVDTTVQPNAITFPTDAKLLHAAIKGLELSGEEARDQAAAAYLRMPRSRR
jgi:IS5 family transposase